MENGEAVVKNINDMFIWLSEELNEHSLLIKGKILDCCDKELYEEEDELKQQQKDMRRLKEKIENLRKEYLSLFRSDEHEDVSIKSYDDLSDWTDTNIEEIYLFGSAYQVTKWRKVIILLLEELYVRKPEYVKKLDQNDDFKGRTRNAFSYDETIIDTKFYKKLTFGLYVLVNMNANAIMSFSRKILISAGYSDGELKVRAVQKVKEIEDEINIESDDNGVIKLHRKYASISIGRDLFKDIVFSLLKRKDNYGTDFIEPRSVEKRFEESITEKTKYTTAYHVVINIFNYLKDCKLINNYPGTKKGKYIVIDDNSLKSWIENNI